jgi:hypothetical protein
MRLLRVKAAHPTGSPWLFTTYALASRLLGELDGGQGNEPGQGFGKGF